MARKKSAQSSTETLHKAILNCLDAMGRLSGKFINPTDSEPEELAELRQAAQNMPEMDEDPFVGTSLIELPSDGSSWHHVAWKRARDWAQRLTTILADPKRRERGQGMKMPGLDVPFERFKTFLLVEMNRVRERIRHDVEKTVAAKEKTSVAIKRLQRTEQAVLSIIKAQPKGKGVNGKEIVKQLKAKGIDLAESSLRKHILPKLIQSHGVVNHRAAGGYLMA